MRGDALKHLVACAASGTEPTEAELGNGIADAADVLFDLLADIKRIADAATSLSETLDGDVARISGHLDTLAGCVDDNCQPAFVVKTIAELTPADDD